jgi:hypothetical protein
MVLGFFAGLVFALGVVVLLQQYSVWTLNLVNFIVLPVVVGLAAGWRAWRGRAYRLTVVTTVTTPAAAENDEDEPPPPPPATETHPIFDADPEPPPSAPAV